MSSSDDEELSIDWSGLGNDDAEDDHHDDGAPGIEQDASDEQDFQQSAPDASGGTDDEWDGESLELADIETESSTDEKKEPASGQKNDSARRAGSKDARKKAGFRSSVNPGKPTFSGVLSRGVRLFGHSLTDLLVWFVVGMSLAGLLAVVATIFVPGLDTIVWALFDDSVDQTNAIKRFVVRYQFRTLVLGFVSVVLIGGWNASYFPILRDHFFVGDSLEEGQVFRSASSCFPGVFALIVLLMPLTTIGLMMCVLPGLIMVVVAGPALYLRATGYGGSFACIKKGWTWVKQHWKVVISLQAILGVGSYAVAFMSQLMGPAIGALIGIGFWATVIIQLTVGTLSQFVITSIWATLFASIESYEDKKPPTPALDRH